MKRLCYFLSLVLLISLAGCTTKVLPDEQTTDDSKYYVKYAASGIGGTYNVSYSDVQGTITLKQIREGSLERTIGPVSKGFHASISINSGYYLPPVVRIEVKKDKEPFVVKAEKVGMAYYGAELNYVIE